MRIRDARRALESPRFGHVECDPRSGVSVSKTDHIFKGVVNRLYDYVSDARIGDRLPSERQLCGLLAASNTTIRSAISHALKDGVLAEDGRRKQIHRIPKASERFEDAEVHGRSELVKRQFMQLVFSGELTYGQDFSELDVARRVGASTVSVREFLIDFARYGLIEKKQRGGWTLRALDISYAKELADIRLLLETAAIDHFQNLPADSPLWQEIDRLTSAHIDLLRNIDTDYVRFPEIDQQLHSLILSASRNRFAAQLYDIVSFVFHYHYMWDKIDERERNEVASQEHLKVLRALKARRFDAARARLVEHLGSSRRTLEMSLIRPVAKSAAAGKRDVGNVGRH
jgi:DNA-binding GntR family transcriptional regulator